MEGQEREVMLQCRGKGGGKVKGNGGNGGNRKKVDEGKIVEIKNEGILVSREREGAKGREVKEEEEGGEGERDGGRKGRRGEREGKKGLFLQTLGFLCGEISFFFFVLYVLILSFFPFFYDFFFV